MAAPENLTTASQITTTIREIDFVTQFQKNWDALRTILGISRPIRKAPGTRLVSYKATVDGGLQGGTAVGEGEDIPLTKTKVEPVTYADIELPSKPSPSTAQKWPWIAPIPLSVTSFRRRF